MGVIPTLFYGLTPGKEHGVGGSPVLLVSRRFKMLLHDHIFILHHSESLTWVEYARQLQQRHRGGKQLVKSFQLDFFLCTYFLLDFSCWNTEAQLVLLWFFRLMLRVVAFTKSYQPPHQVGVEQPHLKKIHSSLLEACLIVSYWMIFFLYNFFL